MSNLKYAIFLGCTVPVRNFNYELSARRVLEKLGVELVDIPEFACCGYPIEGVHNYTSEVLAARNLALAEAKGLDVMTLCSACTGHLTKAKKYLDSEEGAEARRKLNEELKEFGHEYKGTVKIRHFARVLYEDIGVEKIKEAVTNPLDGIKVAAHYGCHYVKPSEVFDGFDDPIFPQSLDILIEAAGATAVDYKDKMQCCGGGILAIEEEAPTKMVKKKLDNMKEAGADAMTLICPFCDILYDEYQPTIEVKFETEYKLPVLFYSQLLGLALGLDPKKDLAVKKNMVKVKPLLQKIEELKGGESGNGSE